MCLTWFVNLPVPCVQAQDLTELRIRPEVTVVAEGDVVQVTVDVLRGVNLSGYDLTLTYDPDVVDLVSWAHGPYLKNLAVVKTDLQPGRIRLAAVQVASPGVNGDGTLLVLSFNAALVGESAVVIESVELATAESTRVIPAVADGLIVVNAPVTATPIPSKTATFTKTPTMTLTRTPTRTSTVTLTSTIAGVVFTPTQTEDSPVKGFTATPQLSTGLAATTPLPVTSASATTLLPSSTNTRSSAVQTGDTELATPTTPDQQASSTAALNENRELRELNRLLWVSGLFLFAILVSFIIILVLHNQHKNEKG